MFDSVKKVHFVGIGGIGTSAAAKFFLSLGKTVSGSDAHASPITADLSRRGARISVGHAADNVPAECSLIVYSGAVPLENPERRAGRELGVKEISYPEFLGELSRHYFTVAVTGTNGKSTTTAMLALILEAAGLDPTVIVGSLVPSFPDGNLRLGKGKIFVVEACEYKAHMLNLEPSMIVLTNIEEDHLDYYRDLNHIRETFQVFVHKLGAAGKCIVNARDAESKKLTIASPVRYGLEAAADYQATSRTLETGRQTFTIAGHGPVALPVPGAFNVENALAATAAALELGVPFAVCQKVLSEFTGIWRRFERVGAFNGATVISDYGHHPTAIAGTLAAAREFFPDRRIILCFEPHQHSRTKELFPDFVKVLAAAPGPVIVPEIYGVVGRTEPEEKEVSSRLLVEAVKEQNPTADIVYAEDLMAAESLVRAAARPGDVVIIQGAGDVDEVARNLCPVQPPLKEHVSLSGLTNFRIGGPARYLAEAGSEEELIRLIAWAKARALPYAVLGGASNVLVSDTGFPGLIIKMANRGWQIDGATVTAGAGVMSAALARATATAGLQGLEWAITLPGTVGGAVVGNSGCFGGEMKDSIRSVRVLKDGAVVEMSREELGFGYRHSLFQDDPSLLVLSARLDLAYGDPAALEAKLVEYLDRRKKSQPQGSASAGCVFKNYEIRDDAEMQRLSQIFDLPAEMIQSRRLSAGWIIDQLGLKGKRIGDAQVSEQHGNFILNLGRATASDVIQLISLIKTAARDTFGIQLQEEVRYLGF